MDNLIINNAEIQKILNRVGNITKTNYTDYSIDSIISAFEDLLYELDYLKDEISDIRQDIEDNYKPVSRAEEISYNEKDFL